jgi:CO/xanthine dehydrogenase Mo-binding subunit
MNAMSRRGFASGLLLAFSFGPALAQQTTPSAPRRLPGSLQTNRRLDAWLHIGADGKVTVCTGKVEIGQGAVTALMQIAAEELDVLPGRITMVSGDTALTPNEGVTSGSQSMEMGGTALRYAAAEARAILLEKAAARLGAAAAELRVQDGMVTAPNGNGVSYWALAEDALLRREATASARPKPASEYRIVGQPFPRLDIPAKVTGGAIYVQDMRLPGMLFGRVVRPPSYAARLISVDLESVRKLPGVVAVVQDGRFLGVVARREEQAVKARLALAAAARWETPASLPQPAELHAHLKTLKADITTSSEKTAEAAPVAQRLSAAYTKHYLAHASIGPSCAVAQYAEDKASLHVWSHTQGVFPLRADLAHVLALSPEKLRVTHVQGSGCYGHNGADDVALDAALLARAVPGKPVKLQWMRDDEFAWEPYNPAMVIEVSAGLSAEGKVVEWTHDVFSQGHNNRPGSPQNGINLMPAWLLAQPHTPPYPRATPQPAGAGDRNAVPLYDFPNQKILHHLIPVGPLRTSALRTLGAYGNVFALESFMDELAEAAGQDPIAFRLAHLKDPRGRAVIEAAAKLADWQPGARGDGTHGRGFGFAKYKGLSCYCACVVDLELDRASGTIRIPRVFAAADAGQIINPDGLRNQIEGGIVQATSWTLKEAVQFTPSGITSRDWDSYPILTFPEVPKVQTVLLNQPDQPPLGSGEASQGPAGAAIANALKHAAGLRLRAFPYTPERVKAALERS